MLLVYPYKALMQVWWTSEVRLLILSLFFITLQHCTLAFIVHRIRYLVESKLQYHMICTTWYFVQAMLSYDID